MTEKTSGLDEQSGGGGDPRPPSEPPKIKLMDILPSIPIVPIVPGTEITDIVRLADFDDLVERLETKLIHDTFPFNPGAQSAVTSTTRPLSEKLDQEHARGRFFHGRPVNLRAIVVPTPGSFMLGTGNDRKPPTSSISFVAIRELKTIGKAGQVALSECTVYLSSYRNASKIKMKVGNHIEPMSQQAARGFLKAHPAS